MYSCTFVLTHIQRVEWDKRWHISFLQPLIILLQMNVTSQLVFSANINDMLHQADCIRRQNCFLFYHLGDPENGPTAWQALSTFNSVIGLKKAKIQVQVMPYHNYSIESSEIWFYSYFIL